MQNRSRNFAFLTMGRLQVFRDGRLTEVQSRFAEGIRDRALSIERRHAWKKQGAGAQFMGMWAPRMGESAADMEISLTSLARGEERGAFVYTLETADICALLKVNDAGDEEERLWHSNQTRIRDLTRHPAEPRIACAVWEPNGTANIGVMHASGSGLAELTEGDSLDLAPSWARNRPGVLVYQSAGLGRTREGYPVSYSPFEIHQLDTNRGDLDTLAADPRFDFLSPQVDVNGRLHCIRRPHRDPHRRPWWRTLLDVVLIPWRLVVAIFHFFNFFSMRYTGKPLAEGGSAAKGADLKRMMLWGNLIEAEQRMRAAPQDDAPDLVPKDWELVRREPNGELRVLARGVLSFDLLGDGSILYSNGSAVFHYEAGGESARLLKHQYIERVVAWE